MISILFSRAALVPAANKRGFGKMRRSFVVGAAIGTGLLVTTLLYGPSAWRFWRSTRPIPMHVQLTFYQSRNCSLFVLGARESDLQFAGNDLRHFREGPDKIGVSGTGTAVNGSSIIRTDYNQVLVNGQPLDHSPCSYILEESHSLRVGEIRTYR